MTIHTVDVVTPGVVVYGAYTATDPIGWWDDETACELFPAQDGVLTFDERTTLPTQPLIGCLAVAPQEGEVHAMLQGRYGGNLDCRELRAGATIVLPVEHDGGGLYFGDCKALMGDGEIVAPPEVGALVTASAEPRERPASLEWPRIETVDSLTTLVSGKRAPTNRFRYSASPQPTRTPEPNYLPYSTLGSHRPMPGTRTGERARPPGSP